MEKKNTVLLTVIAVATLLVAVVGATFAYFTATTTNEGNAGTTNVNTPSVADTAILTTTATATDKAYYPGTINYVEAILSAKKSTTGTSNLLNVDYTITGEVNIDGLVTTTEDESTSNVEWKLYRSKTQITDFVTGCLADPKHIGTGTTGEGANGIPVGETRYYDACALDATKFSGAVGKDDENAATAGLVLIAEGNTSADAAAITDSGTLSTKADAASGDPIYYYLIVNYKNVDGEQNAEQGKNISFSLNKAEATNTTFVSTPEPPASGE